MQLLLAIKGRAKRGGQGHPFFCALLAPVARWPPGSGRAWPHGGPLYQEPITLGTSGQSQQITVMGDQPACLMGQGKVQKHLVAWIAANQRGGQGCGWRHHDLRPAVKAAQQSIWFWPPCAQRRFGQRVFKFGAHPRRGQPVQGAALQRRQHGRHAWVGEQPGVQDGVGVDHHHGPCFVGWERLGSQILPPALPLRLPWNILEGFSADFAGFCRVALVVWVRAFWLGQ
jgi:hypothetical protein